MFLEVPEYSWSGDTLSDMAGQEAVQVVTGVKRKRQVNTLTTPEIVNADYRIMRHSTRRATKPFNFDGAAESGLRTLVHLGSQSQHVSQVKEQPQ